MGLIKDYDRRLRLAWKEYQRKLGVKTTLKDFELGVDFGDPDYYLKWDR